MGDALNPRTPEDRKDAEMIVYIVRNWADNGKYAINTRNLPDALRVQDALKAEGKGAELVCKNKHLPGGMKNQLLPVSKEEIAAARARM